MEVLLLVGAGFVAGVMNAIAGGGGLIIFPALLATGMPALIANATNNIAVLPGQIASVIAYRKHMKHIPRRYLFLTVPCFVGAIIGAFILRSTESENFDKIVPGLLAFAVVLFIFQPFLHKQLNMHLHGPKKHRSRWKPLFMLALAVMPISIYGGYFGVGFGFIMLAFLGFTKLHHMHEINALKNLMGICILTASIIVLFGSGLISWHQGLIIALGNVVGGYMGARVAQHVSSHNIRIIVIVVGVCAATYLGLREYDTSHQVQTMLQSPLSISLRTP